MKKVVLFISILLFILTIPTYATNQKIEWNPVCRHKALYWAITVKEQYQTRIKYGYFKHIETDIVVGYHVQPQVKLGEKWYYFKVEFDNIVIIKDMNGEIYNEKFVWVPTHDFYDFSNYTKHMKKWREE